MTDTTAKLRRGVTGRCSRSACACEAEGLGPECVWLVPTDVELERRTGEPHIDGYPLYSGLPPRAAEIGEEDMTRLTDERIITIRDEHLPSQGEPFDCVAFARAIEAELSKQEPVAPSVRIYWHAHDGWKVEWLDAPPNGGQSNYFYTAPLPSAPDTVQVPLTVEDCAQICEGIAWMLQAGAGPRDTPWERFWQAARKMRNGERWSLDRFVEGGQVIAAAPKSTP